MRKRSGGEEEEGGGKWNDQYLELEEGGEGRVLAPLLPPPSTRDEIEQRRDELSVLLLFLHSWLLLLLSLLLLYRLLPSHSRGEHDDRERDLGRDQETGVEEKEE